MSVTVYPDYYREFRCIAGACRHSCCIGWEIDIDPETLKGFDRVGGALGERLQAGICREGTPHFRLLGREERCPFLNGQGLCDIITELGESALPQICADHPRFRNILPGRVEVGLGLCCEEAARLILSQNKLFELQGAPDTDDELILLRDKLLQVIWDPALEPGQAIAKAAGMAGAREPRGDMGFWAKELLGLEILDASWGETLLALRDNECTKPTFGAREMRNFLCYLLYRHGAKAPDLASFRARVSFVWLAQKLLGALGGLQTPLTFEGMCRLCREFSAEIEYSESNLYYLIDYFL